MRWQDFNSVNIKTIDEQHKEILNLINTLFSIKDGPHDDLIRIVDEIIAYATSHLAYEEELFLKYNYPEKESHTALHNEYRVKMQDFKVRLLQDQSTKIWEELQKFVSEWWINHINNVDARYAQFMNEQGEF